jgi:hypothetical protein
VKNLKDLIGNRTRDIPACSTVSQPTVLPRIPEITGGWRQLQNEELHNFDSSPRIGVIISTMGFPVHVARTVVR